MKIFTTFALVFIIAVISLVGFAYSGLYNVSAISPHSGFTDWLLSTTSHASIERRARKVDVPDLEDEALLMAGINDFDSMCAGCHGAPGREPEAMGQGLNPPAPDLAEEAAELTPAELFWVTKNGIKMTGMPAWGATHDDDSIWPVVAFMRKLPSLNEAGYEEMLNDAAGHGHTAADEANGEHSHAESDETPDGDVHIHEDGSERVHDAPTEPDTAAGHDDSTHEHNDG